MTLREQIQRDEGLKLRAYPDATGHASIGYGRNLVGKGITRIEADYMLTNDIVDAQLDVDHYLPWTGALDDIRRDALVNMAFNMGIGGLLTFKRALAALERREYKQSADEFRNSTWARQVGDRATRLALQVECGEVRR